MGMHWKYKNKYLGLLYLSCFVSTTTKWNIIGGQYVIDEINAMNVKDCHTKGFQYDCEGVSIKSVSQILKASMDQLYLCIITVRRSCPTGKFHLTLISLWFVFVVWSTSRVL